MLKRNLAGFMSGFVGAIMAMGLVGWVRQVPDEVEAKSFVLIDGNGTTRARLSVLDGATILSLRDRAGENKVVLAAKENGRVAVFADQDIRFLATGQKEGPAVIVYDSKGKVVFERP